VLRLLRAGAVEARRHAVEIQLPFLLIVGYNRSVFVLFVGEGVLVKYGCYEHLDAQDEVVQDDLDLCRGREKNEVIETFEKR
jgi:hypothetical protein